MKERRRQPKKQTRDREVGGRLGARPKEVCVQSRDTMQDSTQGLRAVTAMRRCVCRGVCVQRSDTTRDSAQGLRAVTDTSPFHSATGKSQEFQEGTGQMAKDQAFN